MSRRACCNTPLLPRPSCGPWPVNLVKMKNCGGLTGLLHDVDYPATEATPEKHGLEGARLLEGKLPEEALTAIRAHNGEMTGCAPQTRFDFALRCGETITGLISAAALMRPTGYEGMRKSRAIKKR